MFIDTNDSRNFVNRLNNHDLIENQATLAVGNALQSSELFSTASVDFQRFPIDSTDSYEIFPLPFPANLLCNPVYVVYFFKRLFLFKYK